MAMSYQSQQPKMPPVASLTHVTYHPPQPKTPTQPKATPQPGMAYAGGNPNFDERSGTVASPLPWQVSPHLATALMQRMQAYQPQAGATFDDFLRAIFAHFGGGGNQGGYAKALY
jgi:hypothetical protein